jgi:uroporphyrinogen-III synthase
MSNTVLITRARGDEAELVEALHERGYRTIHEPLTEIFLNHTIRQELEQALMEEPDALLITSRHGARALAALTEMRDAAILCVGEATADAAVSAGFIRVESAGGDVEQLITYIADAYDRDARFVYVSAQHIRTDIGEELALHGMQVRRIVAYEALPSPALSDTLIEQLRRGQIDAVTFLSQRAAAIFIVLLDKAGINEATAQLQAFTLSEAVAGPLQTLNWKGVHSARQPTLASLIECMDNALTPEG